MPRTKIDNGQVVELSAAENAARDLEEAAWESGQADRDMLALRIERNARLAETDIFALSDMTLTDEMRSYRQSLRDMPSTAASDPANPTWPTKPE
tara:strand:- start:13 stop:297 length:285 start_codon:yes stop_codon:yes gene_type:complete